MTPVLGLMETLLTSGAVFSTVMDADPEPLAPESSVAVTEHVTVSPGDTVEAESVMRTPVPRLSPSPVVQA